MKKMISRRNFLKVAGASAAALGLAACGGSSSSTAASTASSTAASAAPAAAGKVYYLNFKPEQDQAWQDLAASYTKQTGVPVTVVTAASGQYETTLMSEMEKSEAPTLFQVNGPVGLANWKDYCLDLSGSDVYGQLTSDSFALKDGDAVTSIAYVIETYGIIYNKELLTAAGYTQDDIKGFADLKKVADDIQATLDFLNWCVTSEEGTSAMADNMGFVIPFKAAKDSTNPLIAIANDYVAEGKTSVDWCFSTMPSEEWKNGVGSALTAYAAGTGSWDDVVTAFVDGWAKEYKLANG